jgi:hypothetical protein
MRERFNWVRKPVQEGMDVAAEISDVMAILGGSNVELEGAIRWMYAEGS